MLDNERANSPHSASGIHHILEDLYMADEEYNNAIFEYQTALRVVVGDKRIFGSRFTHAVADAGIHQVHAETRSSV